MAGKYLDWADIVDTADILYKEIDMTPFGWKGTVRIGTIEAIDLIEWIEANNAAATRKTSSFRLIAASLVDENGARIGKPSEVAALYKKNGPAIDKLVDECLLLNNLRQPSKMEARKNDSSGADTAASHTALPPSSVM